jgi:hypothetical protein
VHCAPKATLIVEVTKWPKTYQMHAQVISLQVKKKEGNNIKKPNEQNRF